MTFPRPTHKQTHLALAGGWALLAVPTILWWSESILWVLMISVYANFVGHISAAEAAEPPACPRDCCADA